MSVFYQAGDYNCEIVGQFFGESKEKKTPFIGLQFIPDGGQYERTIYLYLSDKAKEFTIRKLRELGWQTDKLSDLCPTTGPRVSLNGVQLQLRCSIDVYNGEQREKWQFPMAEREPVESDPDVAKRLDNLFGKEIRKTATAKAAATKQPSAATKNGDQYAESPEDIPF